MDQVTKYYEDTIFLTEDICITFKRHYSGRTNVIVASLIDNLLETTTLLASFVDGKWISPNQHSSSLFWQSIKEYGPRVCRILNRLNTPTQDHVPLVIEWQCLKRRFRLEYLKLSRKVKKSFNTKPLKSYEKC